MQYTYEYISIAFRSKAHCQNALRGVFSDLKKHVHATEHHQDPGSATLREFLDKGDFHVCDDMIEFPSHSKSISIGKSLAVGLPRSESIDWLMKE